MGSDGWLHARDCRILAWLMIMALAVPVIISSCVITDDEGLITTVVIRFDEDGFTAVISLNHPVGIPLDRQDAEFIMAQSDCGCRGELTLVGDFWQFPESPDSHGCFIRINIFTGNVECSLG